MCAFLALKPLPNQVITTRYWTAGIIPDQPYLGRALITLLEHKSSLSELSDEEWQDFHALVRKLEPAYLKAFGAKPLNMGCFMNTAYQANPPQPHVHWQVFPRYKHTVEFEGLTFTDEQYGKFYDDDARRPVEKAVVQAITERLKASL